MGRVKKAFLEKYLPSENREVEVEEFTNLRQGNMSMADYSLKFTVLSKYAPSLVSNPRDKMTRFATDVADLMKDKCCMAMVHIYMTLSRLMVYAQPIEDSKLEGRGRGFKRERTNG